jgi:uncharacterized protein (DUF1697 family)
VTPAHSAAQRKIVFIRGINVGTRNRFSMTELRAALADLGYEEARTHLQSGNVVLTSAKVPAKLAQQIEREIAKRFGLDVGVVVRTRAELAAVVKRDPLGDVASNPSRYLVNFLSEKPSAAAVRRLAGADVSPEQFVVSGRELYAWHPDGVHRSKLNPLVERTLGVRSTARNWKTVERLLELADE